MKRVLVTWMDSSGELGSMTAEGGQSLGVYKMISCGFLLLDNKDKLVLYMDEYILDSGETRYRNLLVIPRVAVIGLVELK